jgi:hypothetical protein
VLYDSDNAPLGNSMPFEVIDDDGSSGVAYYGENLFEKDF